ncbi:MAG TPA: hypothetical protein VMZ05_07825 [Spirochaetota bacterium]|nr:hypothetical protein [Spirochaetota bacterium]
MTKDTKRAFYTFIGAFFLSMLVGLITQNPFGIILMRASISAILFGVLVYGGIWLLKHYIPEIELVPAAANVAGKIEQETRFDFAVKDEDEESGGKSYRAPEQAAGSVMDAGEGGVSSARSSARSGAKSVDVRGEPEGEPDNEPASEKDALPSLDGLFEEEEGPVPDLEAEPQPKSDSRVQGDQTTLGKYRIPYDPKTLAKAIKKVMSQDEGR